MRLAALFFSGSPVVLGSKLLSGEHCLENVIIPKDIACATPSRLPLFEDSIFHQLAGIP